MDLSVISESSMSNTHATVIEGFARRYEELGSKVQELASALNQEQFWSRPFPFGNSFGHLVLHLTGNLNYYVGAEIAHTGYVRDRDREFTDETLASKQEVMQRFDEAIATVVRTLRSQSDRDWSAPYTAMREEDAMNRFNLFLRCATHLHHHIGQMTYLHSALMGMRGH
jgi:DinB superfamily